MLDEQARIAQLLIHYEKMELDLETGRDQLSHLESLYYDRIIEYRRGQLKLLAEALRAGEAEAKLKRTLAGRLGAAAECYERHFDKKESE